MAALANCHGGAGCGLHPHHGEEGVACRQHRQQHRGATRTAPSRRETGGACSRWVAATGCSHSSRVRHELTASSARVCRSLTVRYCCVDDVLQPHHDNEAGAIRLHRQQDCSHSWSHEVGIPDSHGPAACPQQASVTACERSMNSGPVLHAPAGANAGGGGGVPVLGGGAGGGLVASPVPI